MQALLTLVCVFTSLCGVWLGTMDLLLRNPGYVHREWISALILFAAGTALAAIHWRHSRVLRTGALAAGAGIALLAVHAWTSLLRGDEPEGYILLIALALVLQAVLTYVLLWPKTDTRVQHA